MITEKLWRLKTKALALHYKMALRLISLGKTRQRFCYISSFIKPYKILHIRKFIKIWDILDKLTKNTTFSGCNVSVLVTTAIVE